MNLILLSSYSFFIHYSWYRWSCSVLDPKINFTEIEPASSTSKESLYYLRHVLSPYNMARLDAYANNLADYLSVWSPTLQMLVIFQYDLRFSKCLLRKLLFYNIWNLFYRIGQGEFLNSKSPKLRAQKEFMDEAYKNLVTHCGIWIIYDITSQSNFSIKVSTPLIFSLVNTSPTLLWYLRCFKVQDYFIFVKSLHFFKGRKQQFSKSCWLFGSDQYRNKYSK